MREYDNTITSEENFRKKQGFFYENSKGDIIDLNIFPFMGEKSNDLLSYKWEYITQGQAVQKIVKFEKVLVEKTFQIIISGDIEYKYLGNLELFLQHTDVDINNLQMGKLWLDDYYLEGYIIASAKPIRYLGTTKTIVKLTIICENGNWQSEEEWHFRIGTVESEEQQYTGTGILYPYDYKYDYSAPFGKNVITNESYLDSDFEITFHGPFEVDPTDPDDPGLHITIGGNDYKINQSLAEGDTLVINSKEKTATLISNKGVKTNVFAYRDKSWNLFEKIKGGGNPVIKPTNLWVDVKLFYERSEPKYTESKWT